MNFILTKCIPEIFKIPYTMKLTFSEILLCYENSIICCNPTLATYCIIFVDGKQCLNGLSDNV